MNNLLKVNSASIRLFKSVVLVNDTEARTIVGQEEKSPYFFSVLKNSIKDGFFLSSDVLYTYTKEQLDLIVNIVREELVLTGEQANSSFHKSWKKVAEASIEQLVIEQIMHYITTYGFESIGLYDEKNVFIPQEELNIPELEDGINFLVIRGLSPEELKDKVLKLISSGIALSEKSVQDCVTILSWVGYSRQDIYHVKNKEVIVRLCDALDIVPIKPEEFVRYLIYKVTGKTLLIKDRDTIQNIKNANIDVLYSLFSKYDIEDSLINLGIIFNRFKPIFLACKRSIEGTNIDNIYNIEYVNSIINKISKLSKIYHKPLPEDFLNSVTKKIKNHTLDFSILDKKLSNSNTFRKIRLLNSLRYRLQNPKSILYRIRNGKGFSSTFNNVYDLEVLAKAADCVTNSIIEDVKKNIEGKKVYIPYNVIYTLPATEKQFTGNFPSGTCIYAPNNMIVGCHWFNVDNMRIDLDVSLISTEEKIGWNTTYRNNDRSILFSGDMTSAPKPNGATELFYVKEQCKSSNLVIVNYYNYCSSEVPFKIVVGSAEESNFHRNYMINPNNMIAVAQSTINVKQKLLGFLTSDKNGNRFYFAETNIGNKNISENNTYMNNTRQYLYDMYTNLMPLSYIITMAGAIIVDNQEECDINLSVDKIEKDTIISMLT